MTDLPDRTQRALGLEVIEVSSGNFLVESQSSDEDWYSVVIHGLAHVECGCADRRYRENICKHLRAAAIASETHEIKELENLYG